MNKTFILLLVLSAAFFINACSEEEDPLVPPEMTEPQEPEEPEDQRLYKFLALGDSYTIGEGIPENQRWPNQLGERLTESGKNITEINIIAQTGWRTYNLIEAIEQRQPANHDLVSLLIGVNNQFGGSSFEQFQSEFDSLTNIAIDLANGIENIFIVSIPDYGVTPFGGIQSQQIAAEIDAYNAYIEMRCIEQNIPFIDVTEISRMLGDGENALAPDNLHPSGYQYSLWVEEMLPVVLGILE